MNKERVWDVVVIGGGIVGLATARALLQEQPGRRVLVLEKEAHLAAHQTGHNSGVIHSGIYYQPGSFKARLCVAGARAMESFCQQHGIAHRRCGKLIVAADQREQVALRGLARRAAENGVEAHWLEGPQMREIEPQVRGLAGLHVTSTGVVDYRQVAQRLAAEIMERGGQVRTGSKLLGLQGGELRLAGESLRAAQVVNCAGLHSDRVAHDLGHQPRARIVAFRGEYYQLRRGREHLVRALIYPVPDPRFPFLGVHCTRMIDDSVHLGPNAVLALAREGYDWSRIDGREILSLMAFPGLWRLLGRCALPALREVARSLSRRLFLRSLQRLVPAIELADLLPCASGVRAQAMQPDGRLVDDFLLERSAGCLHVLNAPSPAATASLEIGQLLAKALGSEDQNLFRP